MGNAGGEADRSQPARFMQNAEAAPETPTSATGYPWRRAVYVACLVLFPLLWIIFGGTSLHPSPSGETNAEQVRAVAESAGSWQLVHLVLAGASLCGIGAVLALRSSIPPGRLSALASVAAAVGVAAAGVLAGVVVMEVSLVAPVSEACARSSSCLAPESEPFLEEFTSAAWNDIVPLAIAGGLVVLAMLVLAAIGWATRSVRAWEALVLIVGAVSIYPTNPGLHGPAMYGLALILVASASIAYRILKRPAARVTRLSETNMPRTPRSSP